MAQWIKGHAMQVWGPESDSPASTPTVTPALPQGDGEQRQENPQNLSSLEA